MLSDQDLAALLAAASKGPWEVGISIDTDYGRPWPVMRLAEMRDPTDESEIQANRHLAALAPALAQELIEKREAGGVLAKAMEEYERMWEAANACPECVGSLCADHALKLILARTTAKDALACWAELTETEVGDGV